MAIIEVLSDVSNLSVCVLFLLLKSRKTAYVTLVTLNELLTVLGHAKALSRLCGALRGTLTQ